MRETRLYGSEGGGTEINRSFLPLFNLRPFRAGRTVGFPPVVDWHASSHLQPGTGVGRKPGASALVLTRIFG
jgi:hypothetical protein